MSDAQGAVDAIEHASARTMQAYIPTPNTATQSFMSRRLHGLDNSFINLTMEEPMTWRRSL
eukprot:580862-Amphidinium_carterae.1